MAEVDKNLRSACGSAFYEPMQINQVFSVEKKDCMLCVSSIKWRNKEKSQFSKMAKLVQLIQNYLNSFQ